MTTSFFRGSLKSSESLILIIHKGPFYPANLPQPKLLSYCTRHFKEIYCFFDNDQAGCAAQDALRLQEMIDGG